ncbi:hypothetical protein ACWD04_05790 [Streptomyces sp. NPDC002911]
MGRSAEEPVLIHYSGTATAAAGALALLRLTSVRNGTEPWL